MGSELEGTKTEAGRTAKRLAQGHLERGWRFWEPLRADEKHSSVIITSFPHLPVLLDWCIREMTKPIALNLLLPTTQAGSAHSLSSVLWPLVPLLVSFTALRTLSNAGLLRKLLLMFRMFSYFVPFSRLIPQTLNLSFLREASPDPLNQVRSPHLNHLPFALPLSGHSIPQQSLLTKVLSLFLRLKKFLEGKNHACCVYPWELRTVQSRCSKHLSNRII